MKRILLVLLFSFASLVMSAQGIERTNSVRVVTPQFCTQYAALYEFVGQTCQPRITIAVRQDPQGASGFLVTLTYLNAKGITTTTAPQFILATPPAVVPWPPAATWYVIGTFQSATIIPLMPDQAASSTLIN